MRITRRAKMAIVLCLGILAVALHLKAVRMHYGKAEDSRILYERALQAAASPDAPAGSGGALSNPELDSLRREAEDRRKRFDESLYAGSFRVLFFFVVFPWAAILMKPKFVSWLAARNKPKADKSKANRPKP